MEIMLYLLVFLNAFQTIYWSWQVHKLINKIMSTDYRSYVNVIEKPHAEEQSPQHEVAVPYIP